MNVIRRILNQVDSGYLFWHYLLSLIATGSILVNSISSGHVSNFDEILFLLLVVLTGVLYPFSKLVWDSIFRISIPLPIVIYFGWKLLKNFVLYSFAIFIAPFGLLYLYQRSKLVDSENDSEWE